ncbi:MAG TPA: glycosyltransferase [Thermoleophilaceae bacterium]|nr:glycosyltransferase [Thermoleophilaceae bacterium]
MANAPSFDVVVPTSGRESLHALLRALDGGAGPLPERLIVVDDCRRPEVPLELSGSRALEGRIAVVRGAGAGPAAARNAGWRAAGARVPGEVREEVAA